MKLIHYSDKPLKSVYSVDQRAELFWKPKGLWLSVEGEDDWRWWCEAENFRDIESQIATEVVVEWDEILHIQDALDLDAFHERYSKPAWEGVCHSKYPDWREIAAEYKGIVIAPYIWERRLHNDTMWYYSWDCASGCIWDHTAVLEVKELESALGTPDTP